jgi:hypothetical protein
LIDGAKDQWALENGKANGQGVVTADISPYLKNGVPTCPIGGAVYTYNVVGTDPACPNFAAGTHAATL